MARRAGTPISSGMSVPGNGERYKEIPGTRPALTCAPGIPAGTPMACVTDRQGTCQYRFFYPPFLN